MTNTHLYQIFYDDITKSKIDPGFHPLDNTENTRPDWYEYFPIKKCLSTIGVGDNEYVGIFSPKFFEKTGMSSYDVRKTLENSAADVISFSPWYAHLCLNRNIFIQADAFHPGAQDIFNEILPMLGISLDTDQCVMSSDQAILCNYFVAKNGYGIYGFQRLIKYLSYQNHKAVRLL